MKKNNNNNTDEQRHLFALALGFVLLTIILFLSSCSAAQTIHKEQVRERVHVVSGYSTTASIAATRIPSEPLIVVHSERITDTVLRVLYRNDTIFAEVHCPDDTVRLYDTLRIETILPARSATAEATQLIHSTSFLILIASLAFGGIYIIWRLRK